MTSRINPRCTAEQALCVLDLIRDAATTHSSDPVRAAAEAAEKRRVSSPV